MEKFMSGVEENMVLLVLAVEIQNIPLAGYRLMIGFH